MREALLQSDRQIWQAKVVFSALLRTLEVASRRDNILVLRKKAISGLAKLLMGCVTSQDTLVLEFRCLVPTSCIQLTLVEGVTLITTLGQQAV